VGLDRTIKKTEREIVMTMQPQQENANILTIEYGKISETPFPPGTVPVAFLGANHFIVSNGKFIGKKYGVVNCNGEIIIPVEQKHSRYEMIDEKAILLKHGGFTLYNLEGAKIASFKKLIKLGFGLFAVSNGDKYALARHDGSLVTEEAYDEIRPFNGDICIALNEKTVTGFSTDAAALFKIEEIEEIRDFCNGYAVIKKSGKYGAIDKNGNFVLQAKWTWLRDSVNDAFVFSETFEPKTNLSKMGLVTLGDKVLIPCEYLNLEQIGGNLLKHEKIVVYQYEQGNTRYTETKFAFSLLDYSGKIIAPQWILSVGTESEGLRAYARYYSDNHIEFGYMDNAWNSALKVYDARSLFSIFTFQIDNLLSPFFQGKAFNSLYVDESCIFESRWIDKKGETTSEGEILKIEKPAVPTVNTPQSQDEADAKLIINGLHGKFTPLLYYSVKGCRRVLGDLWQIDKTNGEMQFRISKLESVTGFSYGLIAVKEKKTKKIGYVDHEGHFATEVIYDKARHFDNNRTWARRGKQYYILKREAQINAAASGNATSTVTLDKDIQKEV
jgi:hypothetical protein